MKTQTQRGVVAVEAALILSLTMFLVMVPFVAGRAIARYHTIKSLGSTVSLFLSQVEPVELITDTTAAATTAAATEMLDEDLVAAGIDPVHAHLSIFCNGISGPCTINTPTSVYSNLVLYYEDSLFQDTVSIFLASDVLYNFNGSSMMPYAN